jgi:hypothetical protein
MITNDECRKAAHDYVVGLKAAGVEAANIGAILVFALAELAVDPETPEAVIAYLQKMRPVP